ncbi:hypothetical protein [Collimonas pratensis]|nr:hypothetical protein [Collimonas pratensis]
MRTPDLRGATIATDDPAIFFNTAANLKTATDIHFQKGRLALPDDGVTALASFALEGRRLAADRVPDPSLNAMLEKIKFPQCNISAVTCIFVLLDLSVASQPRSGRKLAAIQRGFNDDAAIIRAAGDGTCNLDTNALLSQ